MQDFTPAQKSEMAEIIRLAKIRHEKERKAAKRQGRRDFPMHPYEGSWAWVEAFRKGEHPVWRWDDWGRPIPNKPA